MPNINRRGFFVKPNGDITVGTNIPGSGSGFIKRSTVSIDTIDQVRIPSRYGSNVYLGGGTIARYSKDGSSGTTFVAYDYRTDGIPFSWQASSRESGSGQAVIDFYKSNPETGDYDFVAAKDAANNDGSSFSLSKIMEGLQYPNLAMSYFYNENTAGLVTEHDLNLVLNAAGDGWVSRLQADYGNVSAASGYENTFYDVNDLNSPHNGSIPAGSTFIFDMDFSEDIGTVRASQSGLVVTFDPNFEPVSARIGGMSVTIDSQSSGTATLSFPDMATALNWAKFGTHTLALVDSLGNKVSQDVDWRPAAGYDHKTLTGADTGSQASIFYNWGVAGTDYADAVPPVAGDQIVYDTTYYSNISTTGIITIADGAPASFTSEAYLIDDDGMQAFNTDSGEGIPAVNPPTATIETAAQTVEAGTTLQLAATVTDADTIAWTTSGSGSFTDATVEDAEFIAGSGGEVETLTLSATNTDGTTTATVDITVNAAVTDSTLNLTVTGIGTGSRSVVLHDRTTREVVYDGSITFTNDEGSVTLTDVAVGTSVYGAYFGTVPLDDGTGLYGVTE